MPQFADVILPLLMATPLTYALPLELRDRAAVGCRAWVPLGKRKVYTAIIVGLHDNSPEGDFELKEVMDLIDDRPIVLPRQLEVWQWMARYYMCTVGEVMRAAMPAGLKLESETVVALTGEIPEGVTLSKREQEVVALLSPGGKGIAVEQLQKQMGLANILPTVRSLMEKGVARVEESLSRSFKPKTETHVRVGEQYFSQEAIARLLADKGGLPTVQARVLMTYLKMSKAMAALTLGNMRLLEEVEKQELKKAAGGSDFAMTKLLSTGILTAYPYEIGRLKTAQAVPGLGTRPLDEQQEAALAAINEIFKDKNVCLLHGVTSSGKTEVYINLIKQELEAGRQVLYLLPEIALTTQITQRLGRVFGDKMGVYHSKFPDNERVEMWQRQLGEKAFPLMLGVRSSLFLPFKDLGLVIVDEEHETSYKQQDPAPRYNARDCAIMFSKLMGAKVLLGTATPSVETYHNALSGKYGLVDMPRRHGEVMLPEICVEDVKELRRKKIMKTPFSPRLTEAVNEALANGEQAILFQNRRGYSPMLECRTCGWTPRCACCDVSLTFHQSIGKLECHYCGTRYEIPKRCPNCGGTELRDIGYGTEKIEAAVKSCFPQATVARMDLDTTRSRTAYERILTDFQRGKTNLLIGTQMVTKGLDFDRVRVVGIMNADQMTNLPEFRAGERAFQMMSQVAGRAGRRGKRGLVVVQTRQPELPVIRQVVTGDYRAMYEGQMEERKMFNYPPFSRIICIYFKHKQERTADAASRYFASLIGQFFGSDMLGPDAPVVGRVQLLYIRKIMLKVSLSFSMPSVKNTLQEARRKTLEQTDFRSVNIYFDVDPM